MDLDLADRTFVVTGGSAGLGFASAAAIVAEGGRVVVAGRDQDRARSAARRLGPAAKPAVADLAHADQVRRLFDAVPGPLGGAVVSVGGPPAGRVGDVDDEQWRDAFESVFLGTLRVARATLAHPGLSADAAIVFVLSSSARSPITGLSISNGLRPGLAMLAKDLADEVGPRGIRINAVLPGRFDTQRVRDLDALGRDPGETPRRNAATVPLRRYGDPAELGSVVAFLLSRRASYLTGALIAVDGGASRAL